MLRFVCYEFNDVTYAYLTFDTNLNQHLNFIYFYSITHPTVAKRLLANATFSNIPKCPLICSINVK